ncbi:hypothetical protein [Arthrobacter sp. SAFR-044]|uniref:hypothetical protein n=1 Tax=Arthrobacter sp. SAFR-044 TaxID=3387278 RepID=UPI003F7C0353
MTNGERQAVVLIHGIGEQRPMDTLRSFVEGLGEERYYSKPDRLSDSLELRRYTLPSTRHRPLTDCYELYWAHHFDSGKFRETLRWAVALIFREPFWRLNRTLRGVVGLVQTAGFLIMVLLGWLFIQEVLTEGAVNAWRSWQAGLALVLLVVQVVAGRFITESLAEAARYLTPHPRNVSARNSIREDGLKLLKKLNQDGQYQRIILVGHSLGSVIGLDLLRLAWDELRHPNPSGPGKQAEAKVFDQSAASLDNSGNLAQIEAFQQSQSRLWHENRALGVPWLVTDFVTLGSPLAHASLLLDTRTVKLRQRQNEREYPRCPPLTEQGTSFIPSRFTLEGKPWSLRVAHHGAPFGPTRWSNLYFPVRASLLGDPVGGPVAPEFGPGVRDIAVRLSLTGWKAIVYQLLPLSHTQYWSQDPQRPSVDKTVRKQRDDATGTQDANLMLRQVLRL